jgi:hypothetical protein
MSSDPQERARVRSRIGSLILEFCRQSDKFHMEDLRRFVERRVGGRIAPASPDRILRQLRQERYLDYQVLSRTESLYRVRWVLERPAEQAELFAARAS